MGKARRQSRHLHIVDQKEGSMKHKIIGAVLGLGLTGCQSAADTASQNVSKA